MTQAPWPLKPLVDVVEVLDSRRVPVKAADRAASGGDVPYYGATGQVGFIDRPLFNEPLLLLGEDGVPFLDLNRPKAYLIDGPAWVNNHAHVLRTSEQVDRRFLLYCLNTFDYRGFVNGTTRLKLTQTAMRSMTIPIPDMREQRRIVEIVEEHLSHLDAADVALRAATRRAEGLTASALHSWMTGPSQRLGELTIKSGYGTSTKCAVGGLGDPVVRIPNIVQGHLDMADAKCVVDPNVDVSALHLKEGDLLIVRTNGSRDLIGRCAVVREDRAIAFASYLIRYQVDRGCVYPDWARLALTAPVARAQIESAAASSAGQYNLSVAKLNSITIPCPSIHEQSIALQSFRALESEVRRLQTALHQGFLRGKALRRAVLAAAFSGRLTGASSDTEVIEEVAQG